MPAGAKAKKGAGIAPSLTIVPVKLSLLVLVHLVASAAAAFVPATLFGPQVWLSQTMLSAFWLGMVVEGYVAMRILAMVAVCLYIAFWPSLAEFESPGWAYRYWVYFGAALAWTTILSGFLVAMRRFKMEVRRIAVPAVAAVPSQFSILQVLAVTCIAASVLGLSLIAKNEPPTSQGRPWLLLALAVAIYLINLFCAIWACLSAGSVYWRLLLAVLTALFLSFPAVTSNPQAVDWRQFLLTAVLTTGPTLIVAASLLVVRSCGFRIVPKQTEPSGCTT